MLWPFAQATGFSSGRGGTGGLDSQADLRLCCMLKASGNLDNVRHEPLAPLGMFPVGSAKTPQL